MHIQEPLPPPPGPEPPTSRGAHPPRLRWVWAVVALIVVYAGGAALMASGTDAFTTQADICRQADIVLTDIERSVDVTADPPVLVPEDLAAAFPNSVLGQPNLLRSSADIVRETIPEAGSWHRQLDLADFRIGWLQPLSFSGLELSVKAEQLGSHRQAVIYSRWVALHVNCRYSNEVFTGPVPGSLGFQVRWRSGDIGEQLSFVRGDMRYTVAVVAPVAPADHSIVDRLALEVAPAAAP